MIDRPCDEMTVGDTSTLRSRTIEFADIYAFAHLTNDHHALRLDPDCAATVVPIADLKVLVAAAAVQNTYPEATR